MSVGSTPRRNFNARFFGVIPLHINLRSLSNVLNSDCVPFNSNLFAKFNPSISGHKKITEHASGSHSCKTREMKGGSKIRADTFQLGQVVNPSLADLWITHLRRGCAAWRCVGGRARTATLWSRPRDFSPRGTSASPRSETVKCQNMSENLIPLKVC